MRRAGFFVVLVLVVGLLGGCTGAGSREGGGTAAGRGGAPLSRIDGKKVLMIIAPRDFRDEELTEPRSVVEAQGGKVWVASTSVGEARGMRGLRVKPDLSLDRVRVSDYDAVVFVGGGGASCYWDDETAWAIAREAVARGKVLAAICVAPVTLAKAGVLRGKRATVWPSEKARLKEGGAEYTGARVEVDGLIITADGPASARAFGEKIVAVLAGSR